MNVPQESSHRVLWIELLGLSITGLLLFVIACTLQLLLDVLSGGSLHAERGVLAFGFLFYVCAAFVAAGTRQQPDQPRALLANVGLRAVFLSVGWLLWRREIPLAWFLTALVLVLVVHGGAYAFARLRRRALNLLARHRAAIEDAFIERFLLPHAPTYHAIPIGGALGTLLGALTCPEPAAIVRHALAGIVGTLAACQLFAICAGVIGLARSLTRTHDEANVVVRAVGHGERRSLFVFVPSAAARPREIASALRRVLLVNQLQRVATCAVALLVLWRLEFPALAAHIVGGSLVAGAALTALVPYALGQRGP
jgi:hypothetical protein